MFSHEIKTEIDVAAPPAAVWALLHDQLGAGKWNPFIIKVEGELKEGGQLKCTVQPPGGKPASFSPTILKLEPGHELRWRGSLPLGLFSGEHYYLVEAAGGGSSTRFVHGERFTGLLIPILGGALKSTEKGFVSMNEALKAEAEKGSAGAS